MITVPEAVESIVKKSTFLEEALSRQIINISALARLIKPDVENEALKEVKEGAIIMALNRLSHLIQKRVEKQKEIFKNVPDLMVRSNLVEMTFANSEFLFQKQKKLLEQISIRQNYFITFTQGIFETTIIGSREIKDRLLEVFKGEKFISQLDNLSSLTVQLPKGTAHIPGAYNYILKFLAWEEINIIEVVSTFNELTIILEDKDIDRAFSIIKRIL